MITILRRQLIAVGEDMVNDAHAHDLEVPASAADRTRVETKLFELAQDGELKGGFHQLPTTRLTKADHQRRRRPSAATRI